MIVVIPAKVRKDIYRSLGKLARHLGIPTDLIDIDDGHPAIHSNGYCIYPRWDRSGLLGGLYLSSDHPRCKAASTIAQELGGLVVVEDEGGFILALPEKPLKGPLKKLLRLAPEG